MKIHRGSDDPKVYGADDEFCDMVFTSILQDRETLRTFARMCVDAYRAHN